MKPRVKQKGVVKRKALFKRKKKKKKEEKRSNTQQFIKEAFLYLNGTVERNARIIGAERLFILQTDHISPNTR